MDKEREYKLKSLDVEDIEQVCNLIRGFRIAMSNMLLYPSGSDLINASVSTDEAILSNILEKYQILILSEVEGSLLANTVRLDAEVIKGAFMESLDACNIKSVTFRQGITLKELQLFLEGLAKKHKLKGTGDSITETFQSEKVIHIGLNEKVYAAIGESDLIIERGAELVDKSGGSIDAIMEALQGVTEMVSSIDDAPARDKVKLQIAEKLIATDPKLLVELIQHKPEVRKEIPIEGVKIMEGEIGFSTAEIKAIVSNITTAYREIMCADSKGLPSLKAVLDRILLLTKDKIPSLELYNELVQQTNMLETPIEVQTEIKGETTIEKLDDLTKKDGLSLITDEAIEGIKKLFEQTGSDNELKLADKLLDKLTHNFGATISDIRLKTAQAFKKLYSGIETLKNPEIVKSVDNQLIATEDKESHGPTYSEIASILQEAANRYLKEGNRKKSSEIIQLFRKHTHSKEGFLDRYKLAEETMHKFAESELSRLLLDELCSTDESKQKDTGLLVELGDFVVSALIQRIKETPNIEVRKSIVFLIEKIGETAITRLVEELDLEKRAESSLRIIELLDKIGHPDIVVEQLRETLSNPDFNVRKAVVRKLNEIGTDRAKQIIVDVITNDPSPGIRQLGIGFLGDAKYTPAVSPLIDLISVQSRQIGISASLQHTALGKMGETIQEETCIALGKIGAKEAIPALRLAARSGTAFRRAKSDKVRVAAVQALVNLGDSEVSKFANDSNLLIQKIVREMQQG